MVQSFYAYFTALALCFDKRRHTETGGKSKGKLTREQIATGGSHGIVAIGKKAEFWLRGVS